MLYQIISSSSLNVRVSRVSCHSIRVRSRHAMIIWSFVLVHLIGQRFSNPGKAIVTFIKAKASKTRMKKHRFLLVINSKHQKDFRDTLFYFFSGTMCFCFQYLDFCWGGNSPWLFKKGVVLGRCLDAPLTGGRFELGFATF